MADLIKPEDVTGINKMEVEEITEFSEQVMHADSKLQEITDELENLSDCLYNLNLSKIEYDKKAKYVKGQMRSLAGRL